MSALSSPKIRSPSEQNPSTESDAVQHDRLQLLRAMLNDREWSCDAFARVRLERVLADLGGNRSHDGDHADIDESAWSLLAEETERYLDYRRLGDLEARLRGRPRADFRFTRDDWAMARIAEAELHAHYRHVRESSYAPEPVALFRIH